MSDELSICTLDGVHIDHAYKFLGNWIDGKLCLKKHIDELIKKLRIKVGFFYRNRSCFSLNSRKQIIQSTFLLVLHYGDIIYYMNAAAISLKPLVAVYHSALCFIAGNNFCTHCILTASLHSLSESWLAVFDVP
jgi:hypothetical protein